MDINQLPHTEKPEELRLAGCRRIYIIGSIASGKTALARKLSHRLGIPWYELDSVIWKRNPRGDEKRTEEQRDKIFKNIIISEKWIIEDVLRPCFAKGLRMADLIILLDPPKRKAKWYALIRWLRQAFRFDRPKYRSRVTMFKSMSGWSGDFELNQNDFMKRLKPYLGKVLTLKSIREIDSYL